MRKHTSQNQPFKMARLSMIHKTNQLYNPGQSWKNFLSQYKSKCLPGHISTMDYIYNRETRQTPLTNKVIYHASFSSMVNIGLFLRTKLVKRGQKVMIVFSDITTGGHFNTSGRYMNEDTAVQVSKLQIDSLISNLFEKGKHYNDADEDRTEFYRRMLSGTTSVVIEELEGGKTQKETFTEINGNHVYSPSNTHNNCGLVALAGAYKLQKVKYAKLKRSVNLDKDAKVSASNLLTIANSLNLNPVIIDEEGIEISTNKRLNLHEITEPIIMLADSHYYIWISYASKNSPDRKPKKDFNKKVKRNLLTFDIEVRNDLQNYKYFDKTGDYFYKQIPTLLSYTTSKDKPQYFYGPRCITEFIDFLCAEADKGVFYTVIGHNASAFDLYFLYNKIVNNDSYRKYMETDGYGCINGCLIKGSRILKMIFANHVFIDSYNYLAKPLDKLCKDFRVTEAKTKGYQINGKYMTSMEICLCRPDLTASLWVKWLDTQEEMKAAYIDYCNHDVTSLYEIWDSFSGIMKGMIDKIGSKYIHCPNINSKPTAPSFAFDLFKQFNRLNFKQNLIQSPDEELFKCLKDTIIGGISHVAQPGHHKEFLSLIDVVSLYPTAMLRYEYPAGPAEKTDEYYGLKYHGIYKIKITKLSNKIIHDFPFKTSEGRLEWTTEGIQKELNSEEGFIRWVTNIDIERFTEAGGEFEVQTGYIWRLSIRPFEKFVQVFMKMKKEQDVLKKAKSEDYNNAVREASKLLLNSLFGKTLQAADSFDYIDVTDIDDINEVTEGQMIYTNNNLMIKKLTDTERTPIQLGVFILAYARHIMHSYFKIVGYENVVATETDSIYVKPEFINVLKTSVLSDSLLKDPIYTVGKDFGNMDIENAYLKNSYFLGKKIYYTEYSNAKGHTLYKTEDESKEGRIIRQTNSFVFRQYSYIDGKEIKTDCPACKNNSNEWTINNGQVLKCAKMKFKGVPSKICDQGVYKPVLNKEFYLDYYKNGTKKNVKTTKFLRYLFSDTNTNIYIGKSTKNLVSKLNYAVYE